jgi:hypothetical protein
MDDTTKEILQTAMAGWVRHAMTIAAGSLVTAGILQSGQSSNFIEIGSGIALGLIGLAWSWWQKKGQQAVTAELNKLKEKKAA